MLPTLNNHRKKQPQYKIKHYSQDIIPINECFTDGVMLVNNYFCKTYLFTDINYKTADRELRQSIIESYSTLIKKLDEQALFKITIVNRPLSIRDYGNGIFMEYKGDETDIYRREYNEMYQEALDSKEGLTQERYITIAVPKKTIEEARHFFEVVESEIYDAFTNIGSSITELSTDDKLNLLCRFFRPNDIDRIEFDYATAKSLSHDIREYVAPQSVSYKNPSYLKIDDNYVRVFYLEHYAATISDEVIQQLTGVSRNMVVSVDLMPIPTAEALKEINSKAMGLEATIEKWRSKQQERGNFLADIPYFRAREQKNLADQEKEIVENDEKMVKSLITIAITASSKEELEKDSESLSKCIPGCSITPLLGRQYEGLNTVLPYGAIDLEITEKSMRTINASTAAYFVPFATQEVRDKGGIYIGKNRTSGNMLFCNRRKLLNLNGCILGVSGSGKSFAVKNQLAQLILDTEEDILICDPEGEYTALVKALAPNDTTVIGVSGTGKDLLNVMELEETDNYKESINTKVQLILSLIEQAEPSRQISGTEQTYIETAIYKTYEDAKKAGVVPTMATLREQLDCMEYKEAHEISTILWRYTEGSLNAYGQRSTVDISKRIIIFNLKDITNEPKPVDLLVVTDTILNRVNKNWKNGQATNVFFDEFHVLLRTEQSTKFFNSAWKQFRKRNCTATANTQNITDILSNEAVRSVIANSEYTIMLKQAQRDLEALIDEYAIPSTLSYMLANARAGEGVLRYGTALIPFVNRFPKNTALYRLMSTKPAEDNVFNSSDNTQSEE